MTNLVANTKRLEEGLEKVRKRFHESTGGPDVILVVEVQTDRPSIGTGEVECRRCFDIDERRVEFVGRSFEEVDLVRRYLEDLKQKIVVQIVAGAWDFRTDSSYDFTTEEVDQLLNILRTVRDRRDLRKQFVRAEPPRPDASTTPDHVIG